jgi:ubiquinone biosynthesis monooxygenase Coq7
MSAIAITLENLPVSRELLAELRSDHAGEYGAVAIYQGVLAITRSPEVRRFAEEHMVTESRHLAFMEDLLAPHQRTRLLPLWKLMGWSLGALPALFGPRAVYATIAAVESFVEDHYQRQIAMMAGIPALRELRAMLETFCADEVHHKDDAFGRISGPTGWVGRVWSNVVGKGSAVAVVLSKRF